MTDRPAWPKYERRIPAEALKIDRVEMLGPDFEVPRWRFGTRVHFAEPDQEPMLLDEDWLEHRPLYFPGYLVRFEDGYVVPMSAERFEAHYKRMGSP